MTEKGLSHYMELVESDGTDIYQGDGFYFMLDEDTGVETEVLTAWDDAILVELDQTALAL